MEMKLLHQMWKDAGAGRESSVPLDDPEKVQTWAELKRDWADAKDKGLIMEFPFYD